MTEYTKTKKKPNVMPVIAVVAIILALELAVSLLLDAYRDRSAEAVALEAAALEAAVSSEATTPPAPIPLGQLLGVSADDWSLRLVRSDMLLDSGFVPPLEEIERGESIDARAAAALKILIAEARADGYSVYVCSGYRSYETQLIIYDKHIEEYQQQGMTLEEAHAATLLAVNYPGGSEHQLGLAVDLLEYEKQDMQPYIGGSGLMLWLEEHCAEYGFIVRYPEGKTDITGVEYEPWHLRYVGDCAAYIMENDLCLEEFLALLD